MAKFKKGKNNSLYGKIGKFIISSWRGIDYAKALPRKRSRKSKRKPTPAQAEQRARFVLAMKIATAMDELFEVGFKSAENIQTGANQVVSQLMKKAIYGQSPDLQVDFSVLNISQGKIPNATNVKAVASDKKVIFSWEQIPNKGIAKSGDLALAAAFCEELNLCEFSIGHASRSSLKASLDVQKFSGNKVHTWLSFIAKRGEEKATSVYTGELVIDAG